MPDKISRQMLVYRRGIHFSGDKNSLIEMPDNGFVFF
jgi:hypothetical protein